MSTSSFNTRYGVISSPSTTTTTTTTASTVSTTGFSGQTSYCAGAFYAPYVPLTSTISAYNTSDLEVMGDLKVSGNLLVANDVTVGGGIKIDEIVFTGFEIAFFIAEKSKLSREEKLRAEFPALQSAWDAYQVMLKMVEGDHDDT